MKGVIAMIERYITRLQFKGCSENTVVSYRFRLNRLREYLLAEFSVDISTLDGLKQVAGYMLEQYQMSLRAKDISPATEQLNVAIVRSFFTWATKSSYIDRNPADILLNVNIPQKEQPHLQWSDVEKLMRVYRSRNTQRDMCIFSIAFTMGLRVSGICGLNIGDISGNTVTYTNKGGARKTAYIPDTVREMVNAYLTDKRPGASPDEPLFISERGTRIDRVTIGNIFRSAGEMIGQHLTPHSARRTCLSRINELQGIEMAQSIAAHSDSNITKRYLYDSPDHMRELYKDMPLFNGGAESDDDN